MTNDALIAMSAGRLGIKVITANEPNLKVSATAWILAGGAHHTALSRALTAEHLENFAEMAGMEFSLIDRDTKVRDFAKELRWNDLYYHLAHGL